MKNISLIVALLIGLNTFITVQSQSIKPSVPIESARASEVVFPQTELFHLSHEKSNLSRHIGLNPDQYDVYEIDQNILRQLNQNAPETLNLLIPSETFGEMEIELVQVNIFGSNFKVFEANNLANLPYKKGKYYRGMIKDNPNSIVALSIFENGVRGIFSDRRGNFILGKQQTQINNEIYIFYNDLTTQSGFYWECGVKDYGIAYSHEELSFSVDSRSLNNCLEIYFEVDYDIFEDKGFERAVDYVTALFNEVATLYSNEHIKMVIGGIGVWISTSPYSGNSSSDMLRQFQDYWDTDIYGDLGMLLSYQASGGIAAGFSGLCNSNQDQSLSFSSISGNFQGVPTYSWNVEVITHELGHLLGSRHTHACVWNGNGTQIDDCGNVWADNQNKPIEGSRCYDDNSTIIPAGGGTIMSYCHLNNVGINFSRGFGTQPGNVIRNQVLNASCLTFCEPCTDYLVLTPEGPGSLSGSAEYEANIIEASNTILSGADIKYKAGSNIRLLPRFVAQAGANFSAYINGCTSNTNTHNLNFGDGSIDFNRDENIQDIGSEAVSRKNNFNGKFVVYPNPFSATTNLEYSLQEATEVTLSIRNSLGQSVARPVYKEQKYAGTHKVEFNGTHLPAGIYFCILEVNGQQLIQKLMISR